MRSPRGFAAATAFLSALPLAVLWESIVGHGAEPVIHFSLALGSGLLGSAVSDFRAPVWGKWLGRLASGPLALIFGVQGISEVIHHGFLTELAFQGLGQSLEGWLGTAVLLWFAVAVWREAHGPIKIMGLVAVSLAAGVRAYATVLPLTGAPSESIAPALKLMYLLPFVWLLVASKQKSRDLKP